MLRVTLLEDFGKRIRLAFGYEATVPMHFGAIVDPAMMVDFRGPREPLPAKQNLWLLDWADEEMRSTLMPPEVAVHYFGNPNASSGDDERVRRMQVPEYNQERIRVAQVWGDYLFSNQHGPYTTVRIAVPDIPQVRIVPVNQNGVALSDAWEFIPHEFFRWPELLDANADAEMAAYRAQRPGRAVAPPPPGIDISNLSPEQLEALVAQLDRYAAVRNSERGNGALREHREKVKANGG